MLKKIISFITTDIWRIRLKDLSRTRSFFIKQLRMMLLAVRGFGEDKCQLRASALTYYSLLSIVPVVAMAFGIAKGFGFENVLEKQLLERLPGQEEVLTQVFTFARTLLDNTRGGMVAGIGVAILFWTVIKVLGNIEKSFNDIWGIKVARSMGRKFSDYLSIMLICPILAIMSSSATVFVATRITQFTERIAILGPIAPLVSIVVKILPYCVIWVLFTFIYIFMPNTKVRFKSGVLAGVIAGTVYVLVQWVYIAFQVGAVKYNAIYGSFAALPLFLIWLQMSWLIILFGAEISFAHQNVDTYEFEPDCLRTSYSFKKLLALRITNVLVKNFSKCEKPLTASEISHILDMPIRLAREILYELQASGIVSETKTEEYKEVAYQPGRDTCGLTIQCVIDTLEERGVDDLPVAKTQELSKLSDALGKFKEAAEKSSANKLIKEI